ncbi:MAG: hypothetical protein RBS77_01695 [Candidatus Moranbacteria bacterium]|nr:hypothetical protein [Candidatus Moranbacteria bacterium]
MPFPSRKKEPLIILCPCCKSSSEVETNPALGDSSLDIEEALQLDKYRCRDCEATFPKYIERHPQCL